MISRKDILDKADKLVNSCQTPAHCAVTLSWLRLAISSATADYERDLITPKAMVLLLKLRQEKCLNKMKGMRNDLL